MSGGGEPTALRWTLPSSHSLRGPPLYITLDEVAIPVGGRVLRVDIDSFEPLE